MKLRLALIASVVLAAVAGPAHAAGDQPFQLALFDPAQIIKNDKGVSAVRIDLIYGKNARMSGLDIGIVNWTTGDETALQWGAIGYVQGSFTGLQDNVINIADKHFLGLQWGAFNQSKDGHGMQAGWVNVTDRMSGLQLGIVNYTKVMDKGLQIGVANIITEGGIPVLPIVNWRF
jgi:hypothetical protein